MLISVNVQTAECVNPEANEDKFYRSYVLPDGRGIRQYGSQRTGRTGGQFKVDSASGARSAYSDKTRRAYTHETSYAFQIDDSKFAGLDDKALAKLLDNVRASSPEGRKDNPLNSRGVPIGARTQAAAPSGAISAPAQSGDSLIILTDRLQAAITLAVENPAQAMAEFAQLQDEIEVVEEHTLKLRSFYSTLEMLVIGAVTGSD